MDPLFASRKIGTRLAERAVLGIVKRAAGNIEARVHTGFGRTRPHAVDRGATLPEVQSTLGHGNLATTSGYLHVQPESRAGSNSILGCAGVSAPLLPHSDALMDPDYRRGAPSWPRGVFRVTLSLDDRRRPRERHHLDVVLLGGDL